MSETVAEQIVRALENEGVRHVFGVPGEENEALLFALEKSEVLFVPTRHEQGAAFMANVWGRLTGRAGVCLSTLGPGATNLLTGVADANLDRAPLVALTAQGGLDRLHHESHQRLDVVNLFRPVTKWNAAISSPRIAGEVIRKAFKVAEAEKPGATHVELSEDVADVEVPPGVEPLARREPRRPGANAEAVEAAAGRIRAAERPLVLAGNGAIRKRASRELDGLSRAHGLPVVSTFMGKGAVSDRSDRSLLALGLGFRDHVMDAVETADVVLTVGYDIAEVSPDAWNPDGDRTVLHLDFEPAEVYTRYTPEVEIVGDVSGGLSALRDRLDADPPRHDPDWHLPVRRRILEDLESWRLEPGDPFTVPGTLDVLRSVLSDEGLLISDVGTHKMWIARNFPTCCPGGCVISNGLASMGIALPGAIAAALADPDRAVVAAMGDGGFLMNSQELETARRLGVCFTALVLRDDDYGLISWKQQLSRGRSVSTRIGNPDLPAYAESFGVRGVQPESVGELRRELERSLAGEGVTVIDVPVDTSVNRRLVERLRAS